MYLAPEDRVSTWRWVVKNIIKSVSSAEEALFFTQTHGKAPLNDHTLGGFKGVRRFCCIKSALT